LWPYEKIIVGNRPSQQFVQIKVIGAFFLVAWDKPLFILLWKSTELFESWTWLLLDLDVRSFCMYMFMKAYSLFDIVRGM
jgi:hypothetical protein